MSKFILDKEPKITSGFITPENYFENFSSSVMEKLENDFPQKKKEFTLKNYSYAAAAVLLVGLSLPFLMPNSTPSLAQIDTDSLENYISFQSYGSQYEIINLIDDKELDNMQVELNLEVESVENILATNPNFENYITE